MTINCTNCDTPVEIPPGLFDIAKRRGILCDNCLQKHAQIQTNRATQRSRGCKSCTVPPAAQPHPSQPPES